MSWILSEDRQGLFVQKSRKVQHKIFELLKVNANFVTVYTLQLTHQSIDHYLQKSIPVNQFIET